jgi:hypothetical protein
MMEIDEPPSSENCETIDSNFQRFAFVLGLGEKRQSFWESTKTHRSSFIYAD